jgi:hypothetical protein
MPRYAFHLTDGREHLDPERSVELPGNATAREEAVVIARDLRDGKMFPGRQWDGWFVKIVDEDGRQIDTVPIGLVQPDQG